MLLSVSSALKTEVTCLYFMIVYIYIKRFLSETNGDVPENNILIIFNPKRYALSPRNLTLGLAAQRRHYTAQENLCGGFIVSENGRSLYPCCGKP